MKSTVMFGFYCRELDPVHATGLVINTKALFCRIAQLSGCVTRGNPAYLTVEVPLDHPGLPETLRLIKDETGRIPCPHGIMRNSSESTKFFNVSVIREYEEKDSRHLPFAVIRCHRMIAETAHRIQTDDEHYIAKADRRLKARWEFGSLGYLPAYAMNTRLKDVLVQQQMKGFHPRVVLFDKPEKAIKELWQPWSDVVMPRCLLPLKNNIGEPTTPDNLAHPIEYTDRIRDPGRGVHYCCGPYRETELCYSATEVVELGDFDIALTQERVGGTKGVAFRELIVSQRFRQVLRREKLCGMEYQPVRLLKKGEALWENPFESMVGPYDEKPPVADR